MSDDDLLKRAFRMLQRYEGILAAEAWRERTNPPFEHGEASERLLDVQTLLADMQAR